MSLATPVLHVAREYRASSMQRGAARCFTVKQKGGRSRRRTKSMKKKQKKKKKAKKKAKTKKTKRKRRRKKKWPSRGEGSQSLM